MIMVRFVFAYCTAELKRRDTLQHAGTSAINPGFEAASVEVEQRTLCFMHMNALLKKKCTALLKEKKLKNLDLGSAVVKFFVDSCGHAAQSTLFLEIR